MARDLFLLVSLLVCEFSWFEYEIEYKYKYKYKYSAVEYECN